MISSVDANDLFEYSVSIAISKSALGLGISEGQREAVFIVAVSSSSSEISPISVVVWKVTFSEASISKDDSKFFAVRNNVGGFVKIRKSKLRFFQVGNHREGKVRVQIVE